MLHLSTFHSTESPLKANTDKEKDLRGNKIDEHGFEHLEDENPQKGEQEEKEKRRQGKIGKRQ